MESACTAPVGIVRIASIGKINISQATYCNKKKEELKRRESTMLSYIACVASTMAIVNLN
jgi:hypothetical protein